MKRVVVIDDSVDMATAAEIFLSSRGHDVRKVCTDFGALFDPDVWADVDVAVVDYLLSPDLTGVEIAEWLLANAPHVKVVMMSGMPRPGEAPIQVAWLVKGFAWVSEFERLVLDGEGSA